GTARSGRMTAGGTTRSGTLFLLRLRWSGRRRGGFLGGAPGLFLGLNAGLLGSGFLGLAIFLGAATFVLGLGDFGAVFALARFLRQAQAVFLGLALHALEIGAPLGDLLSFRGAARRRRGGGGWLRRRLGSFGDRLWLGLFDRRGRFARAAEDAALLDLDDDRVGAAVAEALLDLAGLDRALEAQRRPRAKLRFFGLVCHSIPSSNLRQPRACPRRVQRLPDHNRGQ